MADYRARAVFFDLDNTLFDHWFSAREGLVALLAEAGRKNSPRLQHAWLDREREFFNHYLAGRMSFRDQRRARMDAFLRDAGVAVPGAGETLDELFATYARASRCAWRSFPDAVPALGRLRDAGLAIAVVTNGNHRQQVEKLDAVGIATLVDRVFSSEETGHAKPAPEAFWRPCAELGLYPADVLHVGDDPAADVDGARRAGLQSVLLDRAGVHGGDALSGLDDLHVRM